MQKIEKQSFSNKRKTKQTKHSKQMKPKPRLYKDSAVQTVPDFVRF
jgi:hypothetical protein